MQAETLFQVSPPTVGHEREVWERYRAECFVRVATTPFWVWSAAHEFEFRFAALLLLELPGATVDVGSHAVAIHAFEHLHFVPIVRMSIDSLQHLQGLSLTPLLQQQTILRASQAQAEQALRDEVNRRFLCTAAPGSTNGGAH